VKASFYPMLSDLRNSIAFYKVPTLRPFVLLVRATCRWRWVSSTGGMILTEKNRSTRRKTCPSVTLSNTNLTRTGLVLNPGPRVGGRRLTTWAMKRPYTVTAGGTCNYHLALNSYKSYTCHTGFITSPVCAGQCLKARTYRQSSLLEITSKWTGLTYR
jgi:hypothetical protein